MKPVVCTISLALLLAGCSEDRDARLRISALEQRLAQAEARTQNLTSSLENLQVELWSKIEAESPAVVDPASKGYAVARNEYGAFPVIVEDAQPYLDGHKVKFRIGNLTSATMTGVTLDLVYGVRDPAFPARDSKLSDVENAKAMTQYFAQVGANKKTRKTLSVDQKTELSPASWSMVETIIVPSKPEDLGRIEVSLKISGMRLSTAK